MMRDDEVLHKDLQVTGKVFDLRDFLVHNFKFQYHMPQKLPFIGVAEASGIGEFPDLSNVVNNCSREQEVEIDSLVVLDYQLTQFAERQCVLEQSSKPSVMQRFGGRRLLELGVGFHVPPQTH